MWKNVDDFKWLRQQQSPNWSILAEADRVREVTGADAPGMNLRIEVAAGHAQGGAPVNGPSDGQDECSAEVDDAEEDADDDDEL